MVHKFGCYGAIFGRCQVFKTDLRLMATCNNGVKPNLSLHSVKFTYNLEAHQYYHGYVVKVNAKNCVTKVTYAISCIRHDLL